MEPLCFGSHGLGARMLPLSPMILSLLSCILFDADATKDSDPEYEPIGPVVRW